MNKLPQGSLYCNTCVPAVVYISQTNGLGEKLKYLHFPCLAYTIPFPIIYRIKYCITNQKCILSCKLNHFLNKWLYRPSHLSTLNYREISFK
ncbi:hypothetical protein GDO86_012735 [Hymenochirus boettgeri]|uniref:Uncharacterized protein n=1 Tax=Hymenochirus boettgeri TaxID=247094 RepID=A0A8T2ITX3_9PIPI|nr:hypothetical protein GDO86_012735 [Hymenochirus boettgeri]